MKKLVVNADDLGADGSRNEGIFAAIRAGVVTSASILVNGAAFDDAVRIIRGEGFTRISWGVHVNLSEGMALCPGLRVLTDRCGCFRGKRAAHLLLSEREPVLLEEEIGREIEAQVGRLKKTGIPINHLDGHQHVHVFPAVLGPAIRAAVGHRIPWFRIPEEPEQVDAASPVSDDVVREARRFSNLGREARSAVEASGLHVADSFRGLYFKGRLSPSILSSCMKGLPDGLTELMVHPGLASCGGSDHPFAAFSTPDRQKELEALLEADFVLAARKNGVAMTPFPERAEEA